MVDGWTGIWYPEEDYSKYPKEKWCDYDYLCDAIRKDNYKPETSMENLISMVIAHIETCNEFNANIESIEEIVLEVHESGGWKEFDYEC